MAHNCSGTFGELDSLAITGLDTVAGTSIRVAVAVRRLWRKDAQAHGIDSYQEGLDQQISKVAMTLEGLRQRVAALGERSGGTWRRPRAALCKRAP